MTLEVSNGTMSVGATILYPRGNEMVRAKVRAIVATTRLDSLGRVATSYKINVLPDGETSWRNNHNLRNPRLIVLVTK